MKTIGCTIRLAEDKDDPDTQRVVMFRLEGDSSRQGTWRLLKDSPDTRLAIGQGSGPWVFDDYSDDTGIVELLADPLDYLAIVAMGGVPKRFLENVSCATSFSGDGQGPMSPIVWNLGIDCV